MGGIHSKEVGQVGVNPRWEVLIFFQCVGYLSLTDDITLLNQLYFLFCIRKESLTQGLFQINFNKKEECDEKTIYNVFSIYFNAQCPTNLLWRAALSQHGKLTAGSRL